jgi:hypothetical protein
LLNYVDTLNSNFNSKKFEIEIDLFLENEYKSQLLYNLYLYRSSYHKDFYKDSLRVIERENLCIIELEDDFDSRIQPKNSNLATMLMYILEKEELDMIVADGIVFYCVFLM